MRVLGIDTSNYTTSCAVVSDDAYISRRKILDVGDGKRGLRQSDALFLHTVGLPDILDSVGDIGDISAVAVSVRPRDAEGSYMPCFLSGMLAARAVSASLNVPLYEFSHQAGHIMAAVRSCGEAFPYREFLAFHLSGGTDELLYVTLDDAIGYKCEIIGKTLDITAGQLIDRTGVMLGMKFPCGKELEALAGKAEKTVKLRAKVTDGCCNLSGIENKLLTMKNDGASPETIAAGVLDCCAYAISDMIRYGIEKYNLPLICAGGVISDMRIRNVLTREFTKIYFASGELSSDNAVGTAYLGYEKKKREDAEGNK